MELIIILILGASKKQGYVDQTYFILIGISMVMIIIGIVVAQKK